MTSAIRRAEVLKVRVASARLLAERILEAGDIAAIMGLEAQVSGSRESAVFGYWT